MIDTWPAGQSLRDNLVSYVTRYGSVTFAELAECAPEHFGDGEWAFGRTDLNIIFWGGVSVEAIETIQSLLTAKIIEYRPSSKLAYMIDGRVMRYPVARRPSTKGYKNPHWLPVAIDLVGRA